MITREQLTTIMPLLREPACGSWAAALGAAMAEWRINTPEREAAFLAQVAHESGQLRTLQENLYYSAEGIRNTWPRRFDLDTALAYAHLPARIGNRAYADRMGNGDEASGDGFRFRGRGPIQITGRELYTACGLALGMDLLAEPERLLETGPGARSAAWLWDRKGLNALADAGDLQAITRRINGGLNGYADRVAYHKRALIALGIA